MNQWAGWGYDLDGPFDGFRLECFDRPILEDGYPFVTEWPYDEVEWGGCGRDDEDEEPAATAELAAALGSGRF